MELATALHHSAQRVEEPREGVEGEKYYAPRRPKPPLTGKPEVAHVALRGQKTASSGSRPAPLAEVAGPQGGQSRSVAWLPQCRRWQAIVSKVMTMASTAALSASSSSSRLR